MIEMEPRPADRMLELTTAYIVSRCIHVVAELSVADRLQEGANDVEVLARRCRVQPEPLRRVLRLLASHGIFREDDPGFFSHTALSETLKVDHPRSMRGWASMTGGPIFSAFSGLMHSMETGAPAFSGVHGAPPYHYFATHPKDRAAFAEAMGDWNRQLADSLLSVRDFSAAELIVDVGGSYGHLLGHILSAHPSAKGIVFDLPDIAKGAPDRLRALGLAERCQVMGGDFFDAVPAGGDVYVMSWILHNWNDADCVRILHNCRRAIRPGGRLLTIDHVMQLGNGRDFGRTSDLAMLVAFGGQERTEPELRELLRESGFRLLSVTPLEVPVSVLESEPF
jgi:SAM-dependent methyltransferase